MPRTVLLWIIPLLAMLTGGCQTTYIPVSWEMGEKVQNLSRSDVTLATLYSHYDPSRQTLRVDGASFEEVMMPSEVDHHLGAYRPDTKLIYRNIYHQFSDNDLRDLMVHEFAHHIWFNSMNAEQRELWKQHLVANPTPLQDMVRRVYKSPAQYDTEDFAFTIEYARPVDIEELATLNLITAEERDAILKEPRLMQHPVKPKEAPSTSQNATGVDSSRPLPGLDVK